MKKIFMLCAILGLAACTSPSTVKITLPDGFVVSAKLADTPETREKGLMFVTELPENEGMLFVFDKEDDLLFWMKNTLIDLDMVFIGADKQVTSVAEEVPHSYTYTPEQDVARAFGYGKYVLELASKTAARHHITRGSVLEFTLPTNK